MPQGASTAGFGFVDYAVLLIYMLAMVGIGVYFQKRVTSARSFMVADEKVHHWLVGLSLLGTYLSAVTMMGLPFLAFGKDDWLWAIQLPVLIITALVITRFVLPRYRDAGVLSVYEFLEKRIHVSSRLMAAFCFVVLGVGRMGLGLYLPAKAFAVVTNTPVIWCILVMGIVVTLYTVIGGIEAVIWTDAIQVIVFAGAALVSIAMALVWVGPDFLPIAMEHHKFRIWQGGTDLAKLTSLWLILQTLFETIRIYSTQQDMTQRYVTAGSTSEANRSVWISILGYIPLGIIFYLLGTVLFVYYQQHPDPNMPNNDTLYPYFVTTRLPAGVAGLVIAGIFSAAMSTIASLMNSVTTVCIEDFWKRAWGRKLAEERGLAAVRWLALFWGVVHILLAWWFAHSSDDVVRLWNKLMGIAANGVLGLMALAFVKRRIQPAAAMIGFGVSYLVLWWLLVHDKQVTFLLRPVICNTVCFVVGYVVSCLMDLGRPKTSESPA
ncbi:MAG: sodium/solute symporter [Armatimonadetes bacterium]|nr:sodium/solute symporter [Armatimonadota bacterium]